MMLRLLTVTLATIAIAMPVVAEETQVDNSLIELLGDAPSDQAIGLALQDNQGQLLDVLSLLLSSDVIDPQVAVSEALNIAPEQVSEIVEIARQAGVSNEIITTAALLAGFDPTVVAEATAAGIQTASNSQSIAPPSAPAVGSNGGGGNAVVSPN